MPLTPPNPASKTGSAKEPPAAATAIHGSEVQNIKAVAGQITSSKQTEPKKKREKALTPEEVQRVEKVKKIMFDLAKTVRSFTIYNQNNEAIRQFIQNLYDSIVQFLETEKMDLNLRFRPEAIEYFDEVIYENANPEESIAIKLYKDGVKEIVFQLGLEKKELVDFIDILNVNLDSPEYFDSDVVSILWERNFEHISYFVIEGFVDYLEPQKLQQVNRDIDLILSLVHSDKPPERGLKSAHLSKEDLYQFFKQDILEGVTQTGETDSYKKLFVVDESEVKRIREEIEAVTDSDLVFQMVEVILNILRTEKNSDTFRQIGDILVQIHDMLLLRSDFASAVKILKGLREIASPKKAGNESGEEMIIERSDYHTAATKDANPQVGQWVEEIIEKMGQEQRLEQIVIAFNQGFKGKPQELFEFLISLNSKAVVPLTNLMGDVSNLTHRRLICDAILVLQDGDITSFAQKLYDERWYVVSDMLYILGKLGSTESLAYMKRTAQHESPKVRLEALGALKRFPMDKVRDVFIAALRDENLPVQLEAIRTIAHFKDHTAVDQILEIIESDDFKNFPLTVKKRFYMALATIEKGAMVPFFEKTLKRNRFWLGSINTDIRVCGAYALGVVGSTEAIEVLKKYRTAWSSSVREAVKEALYRGKGKDMSGDLVLQPLRPDETQNMKSGGLILQPIKKNLH